MHRRLSIVSHIATQTAQNKRGLYNGTSTKASGNYNSGNLVTSTRGKSAKGIGGKGIQGWGGGGKERSTTIRRQSNTTRTKNVPNHAIHGPKKTSWLSSGGAVLCLIQLRPSRKVYPDWHLMTLHTPLSQNVVFAPLIAVQSFPRGDASWLGRRSWCGRGNLQPPPTNPPPSARRMEKKDRLGDLQLSGSYWVSTHSYAGSERLTVRTPHTVRSAGHLDLGLILRLRIPVVLHVDEQRPLQTVFGDRQIQVVPDLT